MRRIGVLFVAVCASVAFTAVPAFAHGYKPTTTTCLPTTTTTQPTTTTTQAESTTTAVEATTSSTEVEAVTSTIPEVSTTTQFVVDTTHPGSGEERATTTLATVSSEGGTPNGDRSGEDSGTLPTTGGGRTLAAFGGVALAAGLALRFGKRRAER